MQPTEHKLVTMQAMLTTKRGHPQSAIFSVVAFFKALILISEINNDDTKHTKAKS